MYILPTQNYMMSSHLFTKSK